MAVKTLDTLLRSAFNAGIILEDMRVNTSREPTGSDLIGKVTDWSDHDEKMFQRWRKEWVNGNQ